MSIMETMKYKKGRRLVGTVLSNKCTKSIVVQVETLVKHPVLHKYIRRKKKFMAHDPESMCSIGDKVEIVECRPMSKNKRWHLSALLEKAV